MTRVPDIAVGVDFGMTYMAWTVVVNGKVIPVNFAGEGSEIPSVIYYSPRSDVVIGRKALRYAVQHPERCVTHFKRAVLEMPDEVWQDGRTIISIAADLVREAWKGFLTVFSDAKNYRSEYGGARPRDGLRIFLAHPSNCGLEQRRIYHRLVEMVGLGMTLDGQIDEPSAAFFPYRQQYGSKLAHGDRALVFDLGGGTFDVTGLECNRGLLDTVVGARGDSKLGGVDFTGVIYHYLCDQVGFAGKHLFQDGRGLKLSTKGASDAQRLTGFALWTEAEALKLQLSIDDNATCFVEGSKGSLQEVKLSRDEFLRLAEPLYRRFETAVAECLDGTGLTWGDISHHVLCGGSAMLPTLPERLAKIVGRNVNEIFRSGDSAQLISTGAAWQAFTLEETKRQLPNGCGFRVRHGKNGVANRNRLPFAPGAVIPVAGATVESLGQFVHSTGGPTNVCLTVVETKPGVGKDHCDSSDRCFDDAQTVVIDDLCLRFDLPAGDHEARVIVTIDPANQVHLGISFPGLPAVEAQNVRIGQTSQGGAQLGDPIVFALLCDASSSMKGPKIGEAKHASTAFADIVLPTGASIALISFGQTAELLATFTADQAVLTAALQNIIAFGGTPMAEALVLAHREFASIQDGRRRVIVLVTDGAPNSVEETRAAADLLKADGISLICVGIGDDVSEHFLSALASSPDLYFPASVPEHLSAVLSNIAHLYVNPQEAQ